MALYGIFAATVVIAAGVVVIFFSTMSMNSNSTEPVVANQQTPDTRVIKHLGGETEITGTPERIVVLDSELAENMLHLGAEESIVGASLWKTFDTSFEEEMQSIGLTVPSHIVDVGDYWQPNLESIAQLEPDLIIVSDTWSNLIYDDLNSIAPTLMFATYPTEDDSTTTLEEMEQTFMTLAEAVNRQEAAVAALDKFHAKLDEAEAKIESAGLEGQKFVVAEVWIFEDSPSMYLYTKNSVASQTLEKIGLQNALTTEENAVAGIINVGTEGLASVALDNPNLHFFFGYYNSIDEVNYYDTREIVRNSTVWKDMEFNKRDQSYDLGPEFKPRPTLRHMEVMIDKVVQELTGESSSMDDEDIRTITHAMGQTEITGIPKRVVVMDIVTLETFLHLGVQPVGLSSLDIQKNWNPEIATEWPDIVDVGNTYEPNLEIIAQLEPDFIFASESEHSQMYDDLSNIAPTIMLNNWPYEDGSSTMLQAVEQNILTISNVMGRSEDGQAYLDSFHAKIQEYKNRIDAAGLAGSKFILANPVAFEGEASLFLFVPNSQNSEILERMGLKNAVSAPEEFARYGHTEVSLEALAALDSPDVHFIYVTSPGGGDPVTDQQHWKDHPVWNGLSFVQDGRVHYIGQINMFRGPIELEKVADSTIEALTSADR